MAANKELHRALGRVDRLEPHDYENTLALAEGAQAEETERAAGLALAGLIRLRRFEDQAGQRDLIEALELARDDADEALQARILYRLPYSFYRLGAFSTCVRYALMALELARTRDDRRGEGKALHDIGASYHELGDYQEALDQLLASAHAFETLDDPEAAIALNGIGLCYRSLGHFEPAADAFERSLALRRGAPYGEGISLINLALVRHGSGELEAAVRDAHAALERFDEVGDPIMSAYVRNKLAAMHLSARRYGTARALYQGNLADERVAETDIHVATLHGLGSLNLELGEARAAQAHFARALELARGLELKRSVVKAHEALSRCAEALGELGHALEHQRRFHTLHEALLGERTQQRLEVLLVRFETEQLRKDREIYRLRNVELAQAYQQLSELHQALKEQAELHEQLSVRDALTGLHNRRFLDDHLPRAAQGKPLTVAVCDIDDFKGINDRFSHAVGDRVLTIIAQLFRTALRNTDIVARYGGEEFVWVLPGMPAELARQVCERVRHQVEAYPWRDIHPELAVTLSIGFASSASAVEAESLLAAADEKLYAAKRRGKNRVEG